MIYESKDFYLSAYLIAVGYPLKGHARSQGFTTFYFEYSNEMNQEVNKFYSLNTTIEPIAYSKSLRALKGVIHSALSTSTSNMDKLNNGKAIK